MTTDVGIKTGLLAADHLVAGGAPNAPKVNGLGYPGVIASG